MQMLHNSKPQNIEDLLKFGVNSLKHSSPTPELDTEILLSFCLKTNKEFLIIHKDFIPEKNFKNYFFKILSKRKNGLPISYIIQNKEFYGLKFFVKKGVLIPRPETEGIIDIVKNLINDYFKDIKTIKILEIGTGSGCIPITLKSILNNKIDISTYELSKRAYKIALKNFELIKPGKINFINKNAFILRNHKTAYNLVISNPPYLSKEDMGSIKNEVKNEPHMALFGGENGLEYYFKLKLLLNHNLMQNGLALFEINEKLGKKTAAIFSDKYSCSLIKDYCGKDRFLLISPQ